MEESGDELVGYFEYNTDLFDGSTIERLANHFAQLLEGIVAAPAAKLSEIELLSKPLHSNGHFLLSDMGLYCRQESPVASVMIAQGLRCRDRSRVDPGPCLPHL